MCCYCMRLAGNTGRKKSPFWHHRTTLSGYIFGTKACIDNRKNLLNSNTSSACPDNMVNFGLLTAEICWRVWSTPANFNGFRVLAALLHGTLVVGVSHTLRRWTEGATYIRQGSHRVGHWPGPHSIFYCLYLSTSAVFACTLLWFCVFIRPHRSITCVVAAYCYRPNSMVYRYVCQPVCHTSEPRKNSWTDRDAVWVEDSGGPREPCIRWDPDLSTERGNFGERGVSL